MTVKTILNTCPLISIYPTFRLQCGVPVTVGALSCRQQQGSQRQQLRRHRRCRHQRHLHSAALHHRGAIGAGARHQGAAAPAPAAARLALRLLLLARPRSRQGALSAPPAGAQVPLRTLPHRLRQPRECMVNRWLQYSVPVTNAAPMLTYC